MHFIILIKMNKEYVPSADEIAQILISEGVEPEPKESP